MIIQMELIKTQKELLRNGLKMLIKQLLKLQKSNLCFALVHILYIYLHLMNNHRYYPIIKF